MATPATQLINAKSMPLLGYGTWLAEPGVVGESVRKALEFGYRHIDCAHVYANEAEIGIVFNEVFQAGEIKREDVFITSKLWVTDFGNVRAACELTLKNLQLDYLDLYLIHLPFEVDPNVFNIGSMEKGNGIIGYNPDRIYEILKEMGELVKEGKLRAIGVSNFTMKKLRDVLERSLEVPISCNQVELNPYNPQHELVDFCRSKKVTVVGYSPLGNPGRLEIFREESDPDLLQDVVVKDIADKHKMSAGQVLLAYHLKNQNGVLVKSTKEHRIKENLESLNLNLDAEDMGALQAITTRHRYLKHGWAMKVDQQIEDLWDGELIG